jgi:PKD repeat protein
LTIEAGVVVNFESAYDFTVNGTLLADGTASAPILFGGGHDTAGWGGIRIINASDATNLTYVIVEKGRATSSTSTRLGGGIYAYRSSPVLRYNVISNNHLNAASNSHARGGGLCFYAGAPDLVNNTIAGNSVTTSTIETYDREGGGIYLYASDLTIVNTILWNDAPEEIFVSDYADLTIAYSDLQGGKSGLTIEGSPTINNAGGNIDADPLFVDPTNGNYELQTGSPAIDAGTATFEWNGRVIVDLTSDQYVGSAPDMGAREHGDSGDQNQSPVAIASANPDHGSAPLTVQFSSDGSYDPDGTISTYAWDFGDGGTSSESNPSYTYQSAGTYQAVVTVTDDAGATDSAAVTIEVTAATQDELHVGDQKVKREKHRKWIRGVDTVLILDQNNQPVAGATVAATYSGPNSGEVSGTTGTDGTVVLTTPWVKKTKETWCFEVTDVAKDSYVYNSAANVVTIECEK